MEPATLDDVVAALNTLNGKVDSIITSLTTIKSNQTATKNAVTSQGEANADANRYITDSGKRVDTPYSNVQREFVVTPE